MFRFLIKRIFHGMVVLAGVVVIVFFIFQAFADPARLIAGQTGDKKTMDNIRKDLYLDKPKWKQFLLYVNDVSPFALHTKKEIEEKKLSGFFIGNGISGHFSKLKEVVAFFERKAINYRHVSQNKPLKTQNYKNRNNED